MSRSAILMCLTLAMTCSVRADGKKARPAADPHDLAAYDARVQPSDREHWAFQPVRRPDLPKVANDAWLRNPLDAFILAGLEAQQVKPAPAASPRALLRRVHLGLTGLPPTLAEQDRFLRDPSPDALDRVIDDLLSRPTYGERWARHWLDLVRYAETNGYERDAARPFVWRYRDYVVRALNEDRPIDRFILEQLAGDELPDANADSRIATGYYRLGPWDDEPADPAEDRFDQLDDLVATTTQVFLGLTVACARCHDHKFEAVTMHDYYRLVAVFNGLKRPTRGRTELDLPAGTATELARQSARDEAVAVLSRAATALRGLGPLTSGPTVADAVHHAVRHAIADLPRGYFMQEPAPPPATHILLRGKPGNLGPRVEPGVPAVLTTRQPNFPPGDKTSLRRLTLARWIASADNPLTARVLVNRVWHYHFGEGIVRTPGDFGIMGQAPTHPELLDWLADRFVRDGWSLKRLHRLILTSNTYRMSKTWDADRAAKDAENHAFWRFPHRRLEAEVLRDSMLAVSGQLNRTMYGPSMYPFVPKEALAGSSDPNTIWKPFDERDASRRTLYAFSKRSMVVPLLEVLDVCESSRTCDRRAVTTVAPQALSLFNGDFVNRQARHLAARLRREVGPIPAAQVDRAYRLALARPPEERELALALDFLRRESDSGDNLVQFCRVLFNLNEFAYAD